MTERELSQLLKADVREADAERALRMLATDITRNAALLKYRREERRQSLLFIAALCAFAIALALAGFEWYATRTVGPIIRTILYTLAGGTALTLLLSPVMAYFLQEE